MFATTQWSLISTATGGKSDAAAALARLCDGYWFPIYAYIRRRGYDRHTAEDLTQTFFAGLLEHDRLATADPTRGRFRTFLLTACQNFLANHHDFTTAQKRGGSAAFKPLDFTAAEGKLSREPADAEQTAEKLFERRWALEILDQALSELRQEYAESGRAVLFDVLKVCLAGGDASQAELATDLSMTEGAVKVAMHRLRQRYRDRVREVIGRTVADVADVDDEVRDLFAALG